MHFTEYWAIVEHDHTIQNPSSPEKLLLLADYCRIKDGQHVLDVGCGKGWLLRRWATDWAIVGIGLEINPWFVAEAYERAQEEGVVDRLTFVEGAAKDFAPEPSSYDVVLCIGASFALGDFDEAVAWMRHALKPGGVLAIGEPFFNNMPIPVDVLADWGIAPDTYRDLYGTVAALERQALVLTGLIVASPDDWDRYVSRQWRAAYEWAAAHRDHPDRVELLQRITAARERYLRWERRYLGWAIFVAQY